MSGLFRRLAKQASGRATTLHAPANLPFHDAPDAAGGAFAAGATMPAEVPSPVVAKAVLPRPAIAYGLARTRLVEVEQPETPVHTADRAVRGSPASPVRKRTENRAGFEPSSDEQPHDAPVQPHDAPVEPASAARDPRPLRPARAPIRAHDRPAPNAPRVPAAALPRSRGSTDSASAAPGNAVGAARESEATAMEGLPAALLPPAAGPAFAEATSVRPRPAARSDGHSSSSATAMPNEVHVHIGRVEVTALQESAPKPRTIRNGRVPMSLDEYLAKRQRQAP